MRRKDYFDQVAHQWDEMWESFFSEGVRDKAFSAACLQMGKIAADIGAGTGFITEGLIRRGLQVIAVDQSEAMLAEIRRKFAHAEEIDYRVGQSENLPIPDEAVHYAFANMYLHHVDSPPEAIKEIVRILKPGGKLVITDLDEHTFAFLKDEHHDRWMGFEREEVRGWFTAVGLKNVAMESVGENCRAPSASISIFVASGEN